MDANQVVESDPVSASLEALLTAIARLKDGLETLPDRESPLYYSDLGHQLGQTLPGLYTAYDACVASILLTEGKKVTCSKSCSACCSHFVSSVEPFELIALDMHLKNREDYPDLIVASYNRTVAYEKILRDGQAAQDAGSDEEADDRALYRYFTRGHACPFLEKDGKCGVYEWRPMACRMFFAESSPRFCSGKYLASPWNRNFQVELPDAAEEALARCSRLLEGLELPEELFPGIVAVNARFGRYDAK
jgi:Fe-S-cluster containining protein